MELFVSKLLSSLMLPPTGLIVVAILGIGISFIWKKLGIWVAGVSLLGLLLCGMPVVSGVLVDSLQTYPAIDAKELKKIAADVDVIVVLAGGRNDAAPEYGGDTVSNFTLERVRYAAWVAKRTGLPLIVSGGRLHHEEQSLAELMKDVLQKEFIVVVGDIESESRTTYENAELTAKLLKNRNMNKILLITHAWHMPRAVNAFKHFKVNVVPAPTAFYGRSPNFHWDMVVPSAEAMMYSSMAIHEIAGELWYELRYY